METVMKDRFDGWFVFQWSCWCVIVFLTGYTALYVAGVVVNKTWFSETPHVAKFFAGNQLGNNLFLLAHVLTALPCLIFGPWLFLPRFRVRHMKIHRVMGMCYVIGVLTSSIIGFLLGSINQYGVAAKFGFMTLAVFWFTTTALGYWTIRQSNWIAHRRWMIRSYGISLAVVTIRFLGTPEGMTKAEWFPYLTWLCWVPNFLVAELYVRVTNERGRLALFPKRNPIRDRQAAQPSVAYSQV
jgi:uncharacterized membrane protein